MTFGLWVGGQRGMKEGIGWAGEVSGSVRCCNFRVTCSRGAGRDCGISARTVKSTENCSSIFISLLVNFSETSPLTFSQKYVNFKMIPAHYMANIIDYSLILFVYLMANPSFSSTILLRAHQSILSPYFFHCFSASYFFIQLMTFVDAPYPSPLCHWLAGLFFSLVPPPHCALPISSSSEVMDLERNAIAGGVSLLLCWGTAKKEG